MFGNSFARFALRWKPGRVSAMLGRFCDVSLQYIVRIQRVGPTGRYALSSHVYDTRRLPRRGPWNLLGEGSWDSQPTWLSGIGLCAMKGGFTTRPLGVNEASSNFRARRLSGRSVGKPSIDDVPNIDMNDTKPPMRVEPMTLRLLSASSTD